MKFVSVALSAVLLATESQAFAPSFVSRRTTTATNMGFGVVEGAVAVALTGAVKVMKEDRDQYYASGAMGAKGVEDKLSSPATAATEATPLDAVVDLSIPYDAAAMLAYEAAGSPGDFEAFKAKYVEDAVYMVTSKKCEREGLPMPSAPGVVDEAVDLSIPYDAAAMLAYESAGSPGDFEAFKAKYVEDAVYMVTCKKCEREGLPMPGAVDLSIPYDAAAVLAYEAAGSEGDFEAFKEKYVEDAVYMVTCKKCEREGLPMPGAVDLSIPYDAAAMLAYEAAGSEGDFEAFKEKYVEDAVHMVTCKKCEREGLPMPGAVDVSIPYDAAAMLAYEAAGSEGDFEAFKEKYVEDAVYMVTCKKCEREGLPMPGAVDLSIPYDAAAMLAYEAAGSEGDFEAFKAKYVEDAVYMVTCKKCEREGLPMPGAVDVSIPYDAAAMLAYEAAGSEGDFEMFKEVFNSQAIATVVAKKAAREGKTAPQAPSPAGSDISIPYDAAAKLAYAAAGSTGDFEAFKAKYEADAVAMVSAKKEAREAALVAQ